jgi:WD40 repeat protein/HEAT repeat protein
MTSLDYQVLSRRIYSDFPVIGWLVRRWAAWQLAKDDGSGEAVAILAEVVTRGQDRAVREMAIAVLNRLKMQDAIDGFCRVWVETRHKDLAAILRSRRYVATEPRLRVLSALKVGALDVVKRGGIEVLDFLLAALSDRDTQVATAAASCASALENRVVIDELCRRWVESRSSQLEGIIRQGGYVASQPVAVRVLTALKLNRIQEIRDGGIEVLDCVLKAFDDRDMEVVRSANVCAVSLTNRGAIDELCKRWASSRNKRLEQIIRQGSYVARQPVAVRVLTALKFNKIQEISNGEIEVLDSVVKALDDRDMEVVRAANVYAVSLTNRKTIDELCKRWAESRSIKLGGVIRQGGYIASQPVAVRVLTALKLNQIQEISDGGIEILDCLLKALDDSDIEVVQSANVCVVSLTNRGAIDELCKRWASSRNKKIESIIERANYIALSPLKVRVLTSLKCNQFHRIVDEGKEVVEYLKINSNDNNPEIAKLAKICLSRLTNQESINYICKQWELSRDTQLEQIIQESSYLPTDSPITRVLTGLKFNRYEEIIFDGIEVVEPLLHTLNDKDATIVNTAYYCLNNLKNKEAIDHLCKKWISVPTPTLENIIKQANYEPTDKVGKALFYFLMGNWEKYENLDFDYKLLDKAYQNSTKDIQRLIATKAKLEGRVEWIKILTNDNSQIDLTEMSREDWEKSVEILVLNPDRKRIWRFLSSAPIFYSKKLIDQLTQSSNQWYLNSEKSTVNDLIDLSKRCHIDHELFYSTKILSTNSPTLRCMAISPDNRFLAVASHDTSINLFDLRDDNRSTHLIGHLKAIQSLVISPDSQILVSAGNDKNIFVWNLANGENISILKGHTKPVRALLITPDNRTLISTGDDKNIFVWNLSNGKNINILKGHTQSVRCLLITTNKSSQTNSYCETLISGSDDGTIRLWDLSRGKHIKTLKIHTRRITSLAIANNSRVLASGSDDETVCIWDIESGNLLDTICEHTREIVCLGIDDSEKYLISLSKDNSIYISELNNIANGSSGFEGISKTNEKGRLII